MLRIINILLLCHSTFTLSLLAEQKDYRPKFDKKNYLKTCWSQANPWWRPNRSCRYGQGGPDYAWHKYPDNHILMWEKVAKVCKPYGMTGLQMEVSVSSDGKVNWWQTVQEVADGFHAAKNDFKLSLFVVIKKAEDDKKAVRNFDNLFKKLWPVMKSHPSFYRLNGAPVLIIYTPGTYSPEIWRKMITHVEKKYGKIIILANAWDGKLRYSPQEIRDYLQVFDGISAYANWTDELQRQFYAMVSNIMHKEFPQKIFEASVHNTYTVHFHYGGIMPKLMEKYFKSWINVINAKPDSIVMTNFFDIYENSRILPSYELDDMLLHTAQYYLRKWRHEKISCRIKPDIYVTNFTNVLLGQEALFEVIYFPSSKIKTSTLVTLEICNATGKVLHSFKPEIFKPDILQRKVFKIPTLKHSKELALLPRIKAKNGDYNFTSDFFPPTILAVGMRPHLLWWARSMRNMLNINQGSKAWTLNNSGNGSIIKYPDYGLAVIQSDAVSNSNGNWNQGGGTVRIMRNGREFQNIPTWSLDMTHSLLLPNPVNAMDWYSLELVNRNGCRYLSPPIWVSGRRYGHKVKLPVVCPDRSIKEIEIEAGRVPFFYYPCMFDTGSLLLDYSGYQHNGFLGGSGYGGGHLARTAYHHEHLGGLKKRIMPNSPRFIKLDSQTGFYRFTDKQYIIIQGGTAFPYASTYEINFRPQKTGRIMGIIGAGNNQIQVQIDSKGILKVERSAEAEGVGGKKSENKISIAVYSKESVVFDKWNRLAVVYDTQKLSLYLNGKLQDQKNIAPIHGHEVLNTIIIGAKCRRYYQPFDFFQGDIKDIRIYGRNLSPDEFLK